MPIDPEIQRQYEDFLNPEVLRPRFLTASIFLAGFELLRTSIIDRLRGFFAIGFDDDGQRLAPEYRSEVLTKDRSRTKASLFWLQENGAIDSVDLEVYDRVRRCRNKLAHELLAHVSSRGLPGDFDQCFSEMVQLLRKIEVWWIQNLDLAVDAEFAHMDVDAEKIMPGPVMVLQLLCELALGSGEQSRYYYDEFRRRTYRDEVLPNPATGASG